MTTLQGALGLMGLLALCALQAPRSVNAYRKMAQVSNPSPGPPSVQAPPPSPAGGRVVGWGLNNLNQITIPNEVQLASYATLIAAGYDFSIAVLDTGKVVSWGTWNPIITGKKYIPDAVQYNTTAISAGVDHVLFLTKSGNIVAAGARTYNKTIVPEDAQLGNVKQVSAGDSHSLALLSTGEVLAWGYPWAEVPLTALSGVVAVSAGFDHSLALLETGEVIAWGSNLHFQCDVPEIAKAGVVAVAAGRKISLALLATGQVVHWGGTNTGIIKTLIPENVTSNVRMIDASPIGWYFAVLYSGPVIHWSYYFDTLQVHPVPRNAQGGIAYSLGNAFGLAIVPSTPASPPPPPPVVTPPV